MAPRRQAAVVFVHGLARKPAPQKLKELWLEALSRNNPRPDVFPSPNNGVNLGTKGVPQTFTYYADVFYGTDYDTDFASYYELDEDLELAQEGLAGIDPDVQPAKPVTPRERAFVRDFEAKLTAAAVLQPIAAPEALTPVDPAPQWSKDVEIASWLPDPVKQAIIKKAAMEAFYFLFDKEYVRPDGERFAVRKTLRERLLTDLKAAQVQAEQTVLVSHSMGTMVAYDVLRNCPECPPVHTLITAGSPLGVREIQEELIAADAEDVDFPASRVERWVNIYDPLDPICGADPRLANDFRSVDGKSVVDVKESNWGKWRHSISHYLAGTEFRRALAAAARI
jgi:hypothetical protein